MGPLITCHDAAIRLERREIWRHASFQISPGSFTAILGPNGSGKTTLLRALLGLVPLSAGSLRVLGENPHRGDPKIGYVPQRRVIDRDTPVRGEDLVQLGIDGNRWGMRLWGRRTAAMNQQVQNTLRALGAETLARSPLGRLSGGEQQRILLAQALVSQPKLLLLDEPLAGLDLRYQTQFGRLMTDFLDGDRSERAVVMVTHDINPIQPLVDQVIYVANRKVRAGKPDEIVTTKTLQEIYEADVEVVSDSHGHLFVIGLEHEVAHPHD